MKDPALAFSLYASTAATVAISILKNDRRISHSNIEQLLESLEVVRDFIEGDSALNAHADLLEEVLKRD